MELKNIKKYITGIWVAKFENANSLREYVEFNYLEDEDNPKSKFAEEIGLYHFDSDFIESEFLTNSLELSKQITKVSFAESFSNELTAKLSLLDYSNKNSIISLTGIIDTNGSVNEKVFDFTPFENTNEYIQFVGLFKYEISE
jgi:Immunity protein 22